MIRNTIPTPPEDIVFVSGNGAQPGPQEIATGA